MHMCPGVESSANLGLISYDTPSAGSNSKVKTKGLMYSAVWLSENLVNEKEGVFSRYGIYRKEVETKENFIKTYSNVNWLWEPHFVSIIEEKKFVYFFFTEYSIEEFSLMYGRNFNEWKTVSQSNFSQMFNLKRVARVARVCKNDQGIKSEKLSNMNDVWTTFRKVKLECDSMHSVNAEIKFHNLKLIKKSSLNNFIGIFHQKLNDKFSSEESRDELSSVLCDFSLESINLALKEKRFWLNRDKFKLDQINLDNVDDDFDCDNIPYLKKNNKVDESRESNNFKEYESQSDLDSLYQFLSEHTILNTKVVGECRLMLPYEVKSMAIDHFPNRQEILLGTSNGKLLKLTRELDVYQHLVLVDFKKESSNINEILVNEEYGIVYFSTNRAVFLLGLEKIMKSYKNREIIQLEAKTNTKQSLIMSCPLNKLLDNEFKKHFNYSTVNWFINESSLTMFINHQKLINGDLMLFDLNANHSGTYICRSEALENLDLAVFNLTVRLETKISNGVACNKNLIIPTENLDKFNQWTDKMKKFNSKLDQLESECLS